MNLNQILANAKVLAESYGHMFVTTDHVVRSVLVDAEALQQLQPLLDGVQLDAALLVKELDSHFATDLFPVMQMKGSPLIYTVSLEQFKENINRMVMVMKGVQGQLDFTTVFIELLSVAGTCTEHALARLFDLQYDDLSIWVEQFMAGQIDNEQDDQSNRPRLFTVEPGNAGQVDNALDKYCENFTQMAKDGKFTSLIGREKEIAEIVHTLSRKQKNNAIVVGEPGVGKTQLIEGLATAIANGKVPDSLKNKVVLSLNIASMLAGAKFRGDFEARSEAVFKALGDEHILFIDEMHTVIGAGAGAESNLDFSNMLKPKLSRGRLRVIGATTYDEYQKVIAKNTALTRRFCRIDIKEPTVDETRQILNGIVKTYEQHHGVKYSKEAIESILTLSEKYIHNRHFPDKAIDLLDAAGARNALLAEPKQEITMDEIVLEVSHAANIPMDALKISDTDKMKNLDKTLASNVFGQDEAVQRLTQAVLISRAGLRGKNTTQGGYLFVGPSGVGKTEIAKTLANTLNCHLLRFDMSEFSEQHTVAKLIGSPPGYVGHTDGNGRLIDELDKHPDSILLLDEVEKAHPDIFNLFLQALDEGTVTSSTGKVASLRNVTIIMTTNLGSRDLKNVGIGYADRKQDDGIDKAVKAFFRPEFLNRLDAVVKFNDLTTDVRKSVAKKFIAELNADVKVRGVKIKATAAAINYIVTKGTEPGMGARPMKRVIHNEVKQPLAAEMLFGALAQGGNATVDIVDGAIAVLVK